MNRNISSNSTTTGSTSEESSTSERGPIKVEEKSIDLLHRISLEDLQQMLASDPGLLIENFAHYEPQISSEKPFKIEFGSGSFSRLRGGRYIAEDNKVSFYAQRKVLSEAKLKTLHDNKRNTSRDEVLEATRKELNFLTQIIKRKTALEAKIKELQNDVSNANPDELSAINKELSAFNQITQSLAIEGNLIYKEEENSRKKPQIYQFLKIAAFKDLNSLHLFFDHAGLTENDQLKKAILEHIVNNMVSIVRRLHAYDIYHLDLKPANFLLMSSGQIILADFGSAAMKKEDNSWDRISQISDAKYTCPFLPFYSKLNPSAPYKIQDNWALSLSILKMYGIDHTKTNYSLTYNILTSIEQKDVVKINQAHQNAISEYTKLLTEIKANPIFTSMPANIQEIILNGLNFKLHMNPDNSLSTEPLVNPEINTEIMQNALKTAYQNIAIKNRDYLADLPSKKPRDQTIPDIETGSYMGVAAVGIVDSDSNPPKLSSSAPSTPKMKDTDVLVDHARASSVPGNDRGKSGFFLYRRKEKPVPPRGDSSGPTFNPAAN
ncbi:MAG: hypothetical protein EPN84_09310 [Legionella sp.]|nr:MAG: hypothetical protein EPN84_09310 [Legionella sp.]